MSLRFYLKKVPETAHRLVCAAKVNAMTKKLCLIQTYLRQNLLFYRNASWCQPKTNFESTVLVSDSPWKAGKVLFGLSKILIPLVCIRQKSVPTVSYVHYVLKCEKKCIF